MAQLPYCDGTIQVVSGPSAPFACVPSSTGSGAWLFKDTPLPFDITQIDPVVFSEFFFAGFCLCLTPYAAAWGMAQIVIAIRRF